MRNHILLVILALALTGCSHAQSTTTTSAGSGQPDSAAAQSDTATTQPETSVTSPPDASGLPQCDIVSNAEVEDVLHLTVKSVRIGSSPHECEFSFASPALTKVSIEFSTSGGKDEVESTRKGAGGAMAIMGGVINAAGGKNSAEAQAAKNLTAATAPPDLPKVGDDQYAFSVGPLTSLIASRGDAYVTVGITFAPDGVSRWHALPDLARRVLAAR